MMKALTATLAALLGLAFAALDARAQTSVTPTTANTTDRNGRVIVSEPQAQATGLNSTGDRQKLSQEVRERLARFEREREAYLRQQEDNVKRLRGAATDAERERIRDQIKAAHDAWQERSRNIREELKDRVANLRTQMPSRQEILDNARDNLRDGNSPRKRRGAD
jgi:hypothetical protein